MNTVNIGVFGRRNVGKSSIINSLAGQDVAIVSDIPGTTTDPVRKRMEIFGLGPCVLIDTAGTDDCGSLGEMRVRRTLDIVAQIDVAVLVFSGSSFGDWEESLIERFSEYSLPVVLVHNKADISCADKHLKDRIGQKYGLDVAEYSAGGHADERTGKEMLDALVDRIRAAASSAEYAEIPMFSGIVSSRDHVLLVCPIDSEAPTGRLILPQVNAIRNLLDIGAYTTVVQPFGLEDIFRNGNPGFSLAVTDSQAFAEAARTVPEDVPLTSFSMLLARSKGCFKEYCAGTSRIDRLEDGDRILILESCTHHSSCDDIGRVKIPALMRKYTGKSLEFEVVGGLDRIPGEVTDYAMVLQCGGCMITKRQLYSRLLPAIRAGVPVSNYGMAISYMKGIYERALRPLLR